MNRVVHFEIHADDLERAKKFYSELFGWKFDNWPGFDNYFVITTGPKDQPGINGGMVKRQGTPPTDGAAVHGYVCTIDVENIDEIGKKIEALGGKLALPKLAIGEIAWVAYYHDTEKNIFGIYQETKKPA